MEEFERVKAETRLKVVVGLLRAHQSGWPLVAAVENSDDKAQARAALTEPPFSFDAVEAEHILDRTLGQRTKRGVESLVEERDRLIGLLADA